MRITVILSEVKNVLSVRSHITLGSDLVSFQKLRVIQRDSNQL